MLESLELRTSSPGASEKLSKKLEATFSRLDHPFDLKITSL
jgi:hypothetical protein